MLKGLYLSKAGMLPQQRRLETVANNLANINTIGYKKSKVVFRELIDLQIARNDQQAIESQQIDFTNGSFKETGNPLDVAIVGEGFFVVNTEDGPVYTRNGNFTLDSEGYLTTQEGLRVLTDGGEIQLNGKEIRINEKGQILVDNEVAGQLRIVSFDDPQLLVRVGNTFFDQGDAQEIELSPQEIQLRPGYLEGSNVEGIQEMVEMIELNRLYELGQKSLSTQDRTLDKLINEAGRR